MIPSSPEFLLRAKQAHRVIHRILIRHKGQDALEWSGTATDGNITVDADARILRTMNLTINEDLDILVPHLATDMLAPLGTEVEISRGLVYADGTEELIPQGIFVITKTRTIESGQGLQVLITGEDRAKKVRDARLQRTVVILDNSNLGAAIKKVIQEAAPWVQFASNFPVVAPDKTPAIMFEQGDDGWEAAYKMAFDAGYRLFFNINGLLDLKLIPKSNPPEEVADWEFVEGEGGTLLYADKEHTAEKTYNKVIVTGEPQGRPAVVGIAEDTNPSSPTYVNGPFGVKPYFYKSPLIRTKAQAQRTAALIFLRHLGFQENMHIQGIPMECLQEDDVVYLKRTRAKVDGMYRVNKLTLPLVHDRAMDVNMAQRTIGGFSIS